MSLEESVVVGWGYQLIISKEGGMTKAELVDKIAKDSHITK